MSTADISEAELLQGLEVGALAGIQYLKNKIIEITPRDPARPPKNRNAKVSGNLKRSIDFEKVGDLEFLIGVRKGFGDADKYGVYQEFGTVRMPPRSFLRKGLAENMDRAMDIVSKAFNQYLNR